MKLKKYLIGIFILGTLFALGFFLFNKKVIASTSPQVKTQEILENKFYEPKFNINSTSPLSYEAKKQLTIDQGSNNKEYLSQVVYPNLKISVLGFKWDGQERADQDIQIKIRFLNKDGRFTEWFAVNKNESTKDGVSTSLNQSEPVIAPESTAFQYKVNLSKNSQFSPSLSSLKFICIDSTESIAQKIDNKISKIISKAEAAQSSSVNIISRASWGCGAPNNTKAELQNYANNNGISVNVNNIYWAPEPRQWQKVVVHHTAGSNYVPDPAGTVRGIWQYHTYTVEGGWGDIGYNFLVAPNGQVFEGRYGGNNVVGGHARPYNYGTIGISVLGDYTSTGITAPGYESITSLIAQKCRESGFAPAGSSNFQNSLGGWFYNMPNIVGHRDCAPTACPGDILYSQLPGIRAGSQNKMYTWQPISQTSDRDLTKLKSGDVANVTLTAKNLSNNTWTNSGPNPVRIGTWNPKDRISAFYVAGNWLSPNRPVTMNEASVAPGANATFNFQMKAPSQPGTYIERFNLLTEGSAWMPDTGLSYYCQVSPPTYSWQAIAQGANRDLTKLKPGDQATITLTAKNTGNTTWYRSSSNPVRVGTTHPRDRRSSFANGTWIGPNRPVGIPVGTDSVAPGATATFTWTITAPASPGVYHENFSLLAEGITWMNDPGVNYYTVVNPTYSWQGVSQTADRDLTKLQPGEIANVTLTARNTSDVAWIKSGPNPVRIGTWRPMDRSSAFYAPGNWLAPNRSATMNEASVAPGANATFNFQMKAPSQPGTYIERFNLLAEGITWMNDVGLCYTAAVLPSIQVYGNLGCQAGDTLGNVLGQGGNNQICSVSYANGNYYLKTPTVSKVSSLPIRFYPTGGHLILASYYDPNWNGSANYNEFRGIIEARYSATSNKFWAINELPMEDYLKGIAETNSGNPEYIKSMVVVARSYAYWHWSRNGKHPGEPFILKNSRRGNGNDQVYCGYGFEYRVPGWPNSSLMNAINATSKQVVAGYGNAICITPYSHGARGSTRPGSAIGLNYPWLQAESDPYGDPNAGLNNPPGNHLVGLSASGASGYADRGSSYQNILAHYYRGTGLNTLGNPGIRIAIYGF